VLSRYFLQGRAARVDAFKAHPQNAHYAATKAAVVSLSPNPSRRNAPQTRFW